MATKMQNVVAFVTGAASGIGKAMVERIITHGGKAVFLDCKREGQKLAETLGSKAIFLEGDVTSEKDIEKALEHAQEKFGGINVVVNCAGIAKIATPYDFETGKSHPLELYKKVMDVNALGTFIVTRLAAGLMAENVPDENEQRGVIINIGSIWRGNAPACLVAYSASKAAVCGMTIPFARGFASKGIRVVTISPGYTDTHMAASIRNDQAQHAAALNEILTPKRAAKPAEVAHLAQSIIENPYINAVNMEISGGYHYINSLS